VTTEILYWQIRRSDTLDKYRQAVVTHDEKLRESAMEEIQKFNSEAPSAKLRITGKVRAESLRTWRKGVRAEEAFGSRTKMFRGVAQDVHESYQEGGE